MGMTVNPKAAAKRLHKRLEDHSWFRTVGVGLVNGREGLIVYVSRLYYQQLTGSVPLTWEGLLVNVRETSDVRPATTASLRVTNADPRPGKFA